MHVLQVLTTEGQQSGTESYTAVMSGVRQVTPERCSLPEFTLKFCFAFKVKMSVAFELDLQLCTNCTLQIPKQIIQQQ